MPRVNIPKDEPLPEGAYVAKAVSVMVGETKAHDPMWNVTLQVIDGPYVGQTVQDRLVFSANPAAIKRLRCVAKAYGLPHEGDVDFSEDDILQVPVQIKVEPDEYQGQLKAKVAFAGYKRMPPEAAKPAPVKAPARDRVQEAFGGQPDPCPKEPVNLPEHDEPPMPDDEIPF